MDDRTIIQLIISKDPAGLELLKKHYEPLIRYVVKPICGEDPGLVEDCLQETELKVWEKIGSFDAEKGTFKGWLTAIAKNTALNMVRKVQNLDAGDVLNDESPEAASPDAGPEETAIRTETAAAVRAAIEKLPKNDRLIIYRRYYYMQSVAQIAAETGLSVRAVEGRLYRIRQKLAEMLKGYEND